MGAVLSPIPESPKSTASPSRLLELPVALEPTWQRRVCELLAIAVVVGFFLLVHAHFAPGPGNPGIDENAYLVAGKNFAHHFTTGMHPSSPYAYVGPMWIRTDSGWYYPKYPIGVPILNAVAIWISGFHNNAAFYTSPVCAALAVFAMFLLMRAIAGSWAGVLAAVALATNSTVLSLALVPSSHAPAICFSLWGMYVLLRWWRTGRVWLGIAAGLILGFAVTVRYTEGMLLFPLMQWPQEWVQWMKGSGTGKVAYAVLRCLPVGPLGIVALLTIRWKNWRSYVRAAVPLAAWAIPVGYLLIFNRVTIGSLTGYDPTNESIGFTVAEFCNKWETTVQQLHLYGLFFLLPLGVLGMLVMFNKSWWRLGLFLALWFLPGAALYTAYYWGQRTPGVAYLRFFLSLYPPVIASALWLISMAARGLQDRQTATHADGGWRWSIAYPVGSAMFIGVVAMVGIHVSLPNLKNQKIYNASLAYISRAFLEAVPAARQQRGRPEPLFFSDDGGVFSRLLMHLQFVGDGEWFSSRAFTNSGGAGLGILGGMGRRPPGRDNDNDPGQNDPDLANPVLIQQERRDFTRQLYANKTQADLTTEEARLINAALDAFRPVHAVLGSAAVSGFTRRMNNEGFDTKQVATWTVPGAAPTTSASTQPPRDPRSGGFRPGRPPGPGPGGMGAMLGRTSGGLAPPGGGFFRTDMAGQSWMVVQVLRRVETPAK